jgi:hypothetical protein
MTSGKGKVNWFFKDPPEKQLTVISKAQIGDEMHSVLLHASIDDLDIQ